MLIGDADSNTAHMVPLYLRFAVSLLHSTANLTDSLNKESNKYALTMKFGIGTYIS